MPGDVSSPEQRWRNTILLRSSHNRPCGSESPPMSRAPEHASPSSAPLPAEIDIFVIGAGPAGLTTAYCLTKETPSVVVIEKDQTYVGGISRTVRYKDFMITTTDGV